MVESLLEKELAQHVGAAPYERTAERRGHHGGHDRRRLTTKVSERRGPARPPPRGGQRGVQRAPFIFTMQTYYPEHTQRM